MTKVLVRIVSGKIIIDFEGFVGDACSREEDAIRALYGAMGVQSDVEYSDTKREREGSGVVERERTSS